MHEAELGSLKPLQVIAKMGLMSPTNAVVVANVVASVSSCCCVYS